MNKLSCIVVDDELQNQEILIKMIDQYCPAVHFLGKASCVSEAISLIDEKKPDIVFLDIDMPGGNGFTLFDKKPDPDFFVIFTTAHADYAIKAIKFAALDYLLKPLNLVELKLAIERAFVKIEKQKNELNDLGQKQIEVLLTNNSSTNGSFRKIAIPTGNGLEFYRLDDIIRCEADRAYCSFYMVNGRRVVVSNSLKEYEDILVSANFFRVHKSSMVNLNHVEKYVRGKGGYVIMSDGSFVIVAIRKKQELLDVLAA